MPFDKDKFISQATVGGMNESQATFLADQMGMQSLGQADLEGLERKLRSEFGILIGELRSEVEYGATLTRVQVDDLGKDFIRMEARVEGHLKTSFTSLQRTLYASSAFNTLTTLSAVTFLLLWLG